MLQFCHTSIPKYRRVVEETFKDTNCFSWEELLVLMRSLILAHTARTHGGEDELTCVSCFWAVGVAPLEGLGTCP